MAKRVDITSKLHINAERPILVVGDKEIRINDRASDILKAFGAMNDSADEFELLNSMYAVLFDKKAQKVIDSLELSLADYQTLIYSAIELATGQEIGEGEE